MGNNEQNNNYNKSITISFKGKNYILKYDENMTFFELLKKFDKEYLESKYDLDNLIFFINGVICHPDSTIKSYDYYITDNCIFELNFKKFNDDDEKGSDGNEEDGSFYNDDNIKCFKIDKEINEIEKEENKEKEEKEDDKKEEKELESRSVVNGNSYLNLDIEEKCGNINFNIDIIDIVFQK